MCTVQAAKVEDSHHVNWNSIIYRKGATQGLKQRGNFQLLKVLILIHYNFYHCSMLLLVICMCALLYAQFPMCIDVHEKRFCAHRILCIIIIYEGLTRIRRFNRAWKPQIGFFGGGLREHILEYNLEHICKTNLKLDLKRVRTVWCKYEWELRKA